MTTDAEALSLPPAEAIKYFAGKLAIATQRWDDVWKAAHSRAFMVAGVQADDLLAGIRGALAKAIRQGTTLAEFRADLAPMLQRLGWDAKGPGYVGWRTRLVYETNLRSAYAAGQYEQQTDPDVLPLVPIWRYRHSGARDPRPEHRAWDGLTLRHDDPWWRTHYPPNGWGCGCWVEPLTERQAARAGGVGEAPRIVTRPWTDPASGRQADVPIGIDPGWDYNVGASWRQLRGLDAPTAPPPPDWPPPALGLSPSIFGTAADAEAALSPAYAPWGKTLSQREMKTLGGYKSVTYREINAHLRGIENITDDDELLADIKRLDRMLARATAPMDLRLARGVGPAEAALWRGLQVGDIRSDPGFLSVTAARDVAEKFAGYEDGGVVVEFIVRAGQRGVAYIHPYPRMLDEQEVLVARGSRFRLVSKTADRIVVELL